VDVNHYFWIKIEMREIINKYKTAWPESDKLETVDFEINRMIEKLDEVAIRYEAKWGVYRLEHLATPELAEKWQKQVDKLGEAIRNKNLGELKGLVDGSIRGYEVLEKNAEALGHKPCEPEFWELRKGSRIYRIVKTIGEARQLHKPGNEDTVVMTIEEVVNIFENKHRNLEQDKIDAPLQIKNVGFDYDKGDSIPI